jgi:aminoglycoside phosphotransferase (APT) family kinase protein
MTAEGKPAVPGVDLEPALIESLDPYLSAHVPRFRGLRELTKFGLGQSNPTYLVTADSGEYVLRRKPPGRLLRSAHAIDRGFQVLHALHGSAVPVPRPIHYCSDAGVIGSEFYLMEYVRGRVFNDPALPEVSRSTRTRMYDGMNQVLVALHQVDVAAAGLADYGRPGRYFERQIKRWTEQYRAAETERHGDMEQLIEWLPANLPPDDGQVALVHGDYRLDNMIFDAQGQVAALLDWELSTLGHPCADLAYQCAQWRLPSGALRGLKVVDRAAIGLPTEQQYLECYCTRRGVPPPSACDWRFYLVISLFRLASICQGVYKRGLDGNASNPLALEFGARAALTMAAAVEIVLESR